MPFSVSIHGKKLPIKTNRFSTYKEAVYFAYQSLINLDTPKIHLHIIAVKDGLQPLVNHQKKEKKTPQKKYKDYLDGKHWQNFKKKYWENHIYECSICHKNNVIIYLHHISYKNKGHEKDSDIMPLCGKCHENIHDRVNRTGK